MTKAIKAKKTKTKEKKADFTVVGLYIDNNQTYVGWHRAVSAEDAAEKGKKRMIKNSSSGGAVLAVFFGYHKDVYGKDELYSE